MNRRLASRNQTALAARQLCQERPFHPLHRRLNAAELAVRPVPPASVAPVEPLRYAAQRADQRNRIHFQEMCSVDQKAELKGKLEAFEVNRQNRFEPAIQFVLEAEQAAFLLAEGNSEQKRDFLKKIGSNFQMADKSLAVEFKTP
jgi:hypothetical protein